MEAGEVNSGTPTAGGTLTVQDVSKHFQSPGSLATLWRLQLQRDHGPMGLHVDQVRANALTAEDIKHDTLTVALSDGSASRVIDVTVLGANDAAQRCCPPTPGI